ncbi:unnamed protein product, partial [Iphiclides podalirius]
MTIRNNLIIKSETSFRDTTHHLKYTCGHARAIYWSTYGPEFCTDHGLGFNRWPRAVRTALKHGLYFSNWATEHFVDSDPVFVTTSRGARMVSISGSNFYRHCTTGYKTRWFCATHQRFGCKAVLFTVEDNIVTCRNNHNHPPPKHGPDGAML